MSSLDLMKSKREYEELMGAFLTSSTSQARQQRVKPDSPPEIYSCHSLLVKKAFKLASPVCSIEPNNYKDDHAFLDA